MMKLNVYVDRALMKVKPVISASSSVEINPSAHFLRPLWIRSLGCMPRGNEFRWSSLSLHHEHLTTNKFSCFAYYSPLAQQHQQEPPQSKGPVSSFSSMMCFHPLLTYTPRSLLNMQDLLHPVDFPQAYSPRYELTDEADKFEITIDVPGMTAENLKIAVADGARVLRVSGQCETSSENCKFSSSFSQNFSLDRAVDLEQISASLENGVLTISAPKDSTIVDDKVVRSIPITTLSGKIPAIDESDEIENEKNEKIKGDDAVA